MSISILVSMSSRRNSQPVLSARGAPTQDGLECPEEVIRPEVQREGKVYAPWRRTQFRTVIIASSYRLLWLALEMRTIGPGHTYRWRRTRRSRGVCSHR